MSTGVGWRGWAGVRRAVAVVALAVVAAALAYCVWFRVDGGRWERVESPSMGTTAPVGTLLWVRSTDPSTVRAGDILTFHRPGSGAHGPVYSHRVTVVHADGTFGTAGDLSGPDQWRVAPSEVVGRVAHVWPGVGWLVLAAPVLLLGGCVTGALARRGRRAPMALLGVSLTLTVAVVLYQPLVGAESLGSDRVSSGLRATYVSTGLLPVRVSAPGGSSVVLHAGESGSVVASETTGGKYQIGLGPDLPWWFWPLLVGACLAPALGASVRRLVTPGAARDPVEAPPAGGARRGTPHRAAPA